MNVEKTMMKAFVDELIERFSLESNPSFRATLRKKIRRVCEKIKVDVNGEINLWEQATIKLTKRTDHVFTYGQKELILSQLDFQEFLFDNCTNDEKKKEIEEYIKSGERSRIINQVELAYMSSEVYRNVDSEHLMLFHDQQAVRNKKTEIMIEAIFNLFYTPIDEELLHMDMETCTGVAGTIDHTAETELAKERLKNHGYYKLKPEIQNHFKKFKK